MSVPAAGGISLDLKVDRALDDRGIDGLTDPQSLRRLERIGDKNVQAEAVARQLETVFYGMMIKAMRATVPDGGIDGKGLGRREYMQMLDQQYSQLAGLPRDPRFHEALVRQIAADPAAAHHALESMQQSAASRPAAAQGPAIPNDPEVQASSF
jgi:Rod binding domain-containing protein